MVERRRRSKSAREHEEFEPGEGRVPPHDLSAEAAVLSAVMGDPLAFDKVNEFLRPEHFYSEAHRRTYEACVELSAVGQPIDIVQVGTWLKDHNRLSQVGGMAYLTEVRNAAPEVANVFAYAQTVRDKWRARQTLLAAQRIVAEGYAGVPDVSAYIERAELAVYEVARDNGSSSRGVSSREGVARAYAQLQRAYEAGPGKLLGVPHGFAELDTQTGGLHPGEQTIIAARPGMGTRNLRRGRCSDPAREN
jgi:replicative DNA helicase